ncbi:MAG: DUF4446 family protein [Fimbriimonadaceae bacterium]|nr:DUF4446 family protein [Fimbriimonadaceae bacterium]QYK54832.1 MAG: DUF4446 family protein [Fimbriimonadaceae bacterium]
MAGLSMDGLLQNLNQAPGAAIGVLACVVLVLTLVVVFQAVANNALRRRWSGLMKGSDGESIEGVLERHLEERERLRVELDDARERVDVLERKMRTAKRYMGLVRYDAFEDVGGEQSFALALYDEEGNGTVLTSQVGRTDCRVYAKAIVHGRNDRHLSSEEQSAIEIAGTQRTQPRIHP